MFAMKEVGLGWFIFICLVLLASLLLETGILRWRRGKILALSISLLCIAGVVALVFSGLGTSNPLRNAFLQEGQLTPRAEQGMGLYFKFGCPNCHQLNGWGTPAAPADLSEIMSIYSLDWVQEYLVNPGFRGKSTAMPDYSTLSDGDMAKLLEFLSALSQARK